MNMKAVVSAPWPRVRLGELADHRLGKMLDKAKNTGLPRRYLRNPNIKWFDVDLTDLHEILVEEKDVQKYELCDGDVLICEGGEAGRAAIWKGEGNGIIFQKACHRVRVGPRLDARFLVHRLMFDYFSGGLNDYYTGATIKHFTGQDLARYEIPLPPLNEQKRIAAILDKADQLRQKRRQAIALLDSLTQSIFLEMFGDQQRKVSLGEICTRITDGTHQAPNWSDSGIPFLFVSNIRNQTISFETNKFVSRQEYQRLTKNCPIEAGDVLYTAVGSYGNAAVVPYNKTFVFQRHIAQLKPLVDRVSSIFLAYALESGTVRQQADRLARGVAQKTVTLASLREFELPLPSIESQKMFEHKISNIGLVKTRWDAERLDSLFASLQHRAFSGQL